MLSIGRLLLLSAACLSLSSCSLINTALRLAPYLMMFADENPNATGTSPGNAAKAQQRGLQIQERGSYGPQQFRGAPAVTGASQVAAR